MPRRHPLSLHDERGERRAKGRGETHLDGFSSPFGNPHLFRKSRNASARQARGVSRLRVRKGGSRDVGIFELQAPTPREMPQLNRKHKRPWREPRLFQRALPAAGTTLFYRFCKPPRIYARRRTASGRKMRGSKERRKPHRTVVFPFFGTPLPTFVVQRK